MAQKISDLAISAALPTTVHVHYSMFTRHKRYNIMDGSHHMWRNRKGLKQKALIAERLPIKASEIRVHGFMKKELQRRS